MIEQIINEYKNSKLRFKVKIHAGAKKSAIEGILQDNLKIKIAAPAVDGKANKELIAFLAHVLNCKKSQIEIVQGELSNIKLIEISDVSKTEICERIKLAMSN